MKKQSQLNKRERAFLEAMMVHITSEALTYIVPLSYSIPGTDYAYYTAESLANWIIKSRI